MKKNQINVIQQVSINRFVAEFLNNNRHQITDDELSNLRLVDNPDFENIQDNKERWILFKNKFWLFNRFLPHCDWYKCELSFPECLSFVEIINEESWFQGFPSLRRLASEIDYNIIPSAAHKMKIDGLVNVGIEKFINDKHLILIGKFDNNKLSLIDGNHRFLALHEAYKLHRFANLKIHVIIGFSFGNSRWMGDQDNWEERPSISNEKRYVLNIW